MHNHPTLSPTNFGFVAATFPRLLADCRAVEAWAVGNPRGSAMQARYVAEQMTRHIYAFHGWEIEGGFAKLTKERRFVAAVPDGVLNKITAVRKIGNRAAHGEQPFDPAAAIRAVRHLYDFMVWAAANVSDKGRAAVPTRQFDEAVLRAAPTGRAASASELKKLASELAARKSEALQLSADREQLRAEREAHLREQERFRAKAVADAEEMQALQEELEKLRAEIAEQTRVELVAAQEAAGEVDTTGYFAISEEDTRRDIIDPMLAEAGFSVAAGNMRTEVVLPSGRADYVLYGSDGKALAVVEAKKADDSAMAGREQARQYADELEAQYGQRPIIYYTTGHVVEMWDDGASLPGAPGGPPFGYPPRQVEGYGNADVLYRLIRKRSQRKPLSEVSHDSAIAGYKRPYQEQMIRAVAEHFGAGHRRSLLVMATGTGKTRVSIALVKLLQQAGWVHNVLFLADRTALVKQAAKNFRKYYEEAGVVDLLEDPQGTGTVYVSTYPTMMNLLGSETEFSSESKEKTDKRRTKFGAYAFDLIIVDEAHRSVYRNYKRIFEYFDSLLLGLTATPRDEIDHNTYSLFGLADGAPTGNYDLAQAVADGFLVPFRVFAAESVIMRSGVAYADLSEEEKLAWDDEDWGTNEDGTQLEAPDSVTGAEINAKLYNIATIDNVVRQVLENGIKVAGADRIGKTIFFARNQRHAELIHKRVVNALPTVRCEVVTHASSRSAALVEQFESTTPGSIDIAVSVDMLDTGIDVPEVVNLVFFKPVHSQTKFWQMIGRGTRLCPDLLGDGVDKKEFFVFDYCDNMRMFTGKESTKKTEGSTQKPMSERTFIKRLRLVDALPDGQLRTSLCEFLRGQLNSVPDNSPLIRPSERPYLEHFRRPGAWDSLNAADLADIEQHLAHLPFASARDDEHAKRFDLVILDMQETLVGGVNAEALSAELVARVQRIAENLLTKLNVPAIAAVAPQLEQAADVLWWESVTVDDLELLRRSIRNLVRYVDRGTRKAVVMDLADELGDLVEVSPALEAASTTVTESSVEQKIRQLLAEHGDSLVLHKIRHAQPLTAVDVANLEGLVAQAGDVSTLEEQLGVGLPRFVRTIIGLDESAARSAFADMMDGARLNSVQLAFMNQIIGGLVHNGIVTVAELFEAPYDDYGSPFDVFDGNVATIHDIKERLERIEHSVDGVSS